MGVVRGGVRGEGATGEGQGKWFALGFLHPERQNETLGGEASVIAGGVAKLEGQKFKACVSRPRRGRGGRGVGEGRRLCVCEERRERAGDARGKEDSWARGVG